MLSVTVRAQVELDSLGSDRNKLLFSGHASGELSLHISPEAVPVAGEWRTGDDGSAVFTPMFPLNEGQSYYLKAGEEIIATIELPEIVRRPPVVLRIHPRNDTVPANILKVYIVFDQPMAAGYAADHIRVINPMTDDEEADVFLQLDQELWSHENDTLTMWLDPGRIKRDLVPNEKMGNPLKEGTAYQVRVLSGWPAASGARLETSYIREIFVSEMDRERPAPDEWEIIPPAAGTKDALVIRFEEPMDMGAMQHSLKMYRENGEVILFQMEWENKDRGIRLIPEGAWSPGEYRLEIADFMEDAAGNRQSRLFDQDITEKTGDVEVREIQVLIE